MALVPFPKLLALMADKVQWTVQLGNAFLAQQADVMNAVQSLRHDAMAAGTLQATPQCHCVIRTSGNTISILPSDADLVCIPVYNPRVAYGAWRESEYPPDFFPIPAGFAFEPGYAIGFWPVIAVADFGPVWGWGSIDWDRHDIAVDRSRYESIDRSASGLCRQWLGSRPDTSRRCCLSRRGGDGPLRRRAGCCADRSRSCGPQPWGGWRPALCRAAHRRRRGSPSRLRPRSEPGGGRIPPRAGRAGTGAGARRWLKSHRAR